MRYREKCLRQKLNLCNICGTSDKELIVHHIDGDREKNALDNLLPLCRSCHAKVHMEVSTGEPYDSFTEILPEHCLNPGNTRSVCQNADSSIRVSKATRQRLKVYAGLIDGTQDEAIQDALDKADAPEIE